MIEYDTCKRNTNSDSLKIATSTNTDTATECDRLIRQETREREPNRDFVRFTE